MDVLINIFILSIIFSAILTLLVRWLALKFKIMDWPQIAGRKIHKQPVPLLGGIAVFLTFFIILFAVYFSPYWPGQKFGLFEVLPKGLNLVNLKQLIGLFLAGLLLMLGGFLDDKYHLKPKQQIVWPILACLVVIISGVGIGFINNPFGPGYLHFDNLKFEIFRFHGVPFYFTPWADLFTFIWLMLLMYATKLLDGLDGLVSGLTGIGALTIAGLCFLTKFYQPDIGTMAVILAGTSLGFLIFNFHPAKIFLGEGGSLFAGFILGSLAIISGGKVAIALFILGIAVIDLMAVMVQRIFKHYSPFLADRNHLHFRLLDLGFSHRQTVIFYWLIAVVLGAAGLFLRTTGKIIALIIMVIAVSILIIILAKRHSSKDEIHK